MASLPHNISKSAFRRGEYVAHCCGAQRVLRFSDGWRSCGLLSLSGKPVYRRARTLQELGAILEPLNA